MITNTEYRRVLIDDVSAGAWIYVRGALCLVRRIEYLPRLDSYAVEDNQDRRLFFAPGTPVIREFR